MSVACPSDVGAPPVLLGPVLSVSPRMNGPSGLRSWPQLSVGFSQNADKSMSFQVKHRHLVELSRMRKRPRKLKSKQRGTKKGRSRVRASAGAACVLAPPTISTPSRTGKGDTARSFPPPPLPAETSE
jgi:hypothetical protein